MVSVPVRASPLLAATVNATAPFPVPEAPLVTEIQATPDAALHAQVDPAVTETVPLPPLADTDWLVGEIE